MSRTIPLRNSPKVATVSDDDYERLKAHEWNHVTRYGNEYAVRVVRYLVLMHREVINPIGLLVDHKDGNGLNNQRDNLRPCTPSQNQANRRKHKITKTRFKGVELVYPSRVLAYRARIVAHGKRYALGYFTTEEAAARAYDQKATELWGEFARLNFPEEEGNHES